MKGTTLTIEKAVEALRRDLETIALPKLAEDSGVSLSGLYRFKAGQGIKLATLFNIEKAVAQQKGAVAGKDQ